MPDLDPDLLARWGEGQWTARPTTGIRGVSHDTRTLAPGQLYVALKGPVYDGHNFVVQALAKGAVGAVVARDWVPSDLRFRCLLAVNDTLQALRGMARGHRRRVKAEIIGVTGSVGKTTVKELIAGVLSARFNTARTRGNWNNDIGLPLSLLMMEPSAQIGVFEVGSNHPGELKGLCDLLEPDGGVITRIGPVHLEHFGSEEAIMREKAVLLQSLPEKGLAVLCRDDRFHDRLRSLAPCRVVTVSVAGPADYRVVEHRPDNGQAEIVEEASGERFAFRMPLPGLHNLGNMLFAIAIGRGHGMDWDELRSALDRYAPPPMRWERSEIGGVTVINDAYNANPMSMSAALRTFADLPAQGRKWVVLAGMRELGRLEREAHLALGREAAQGAWAGLIAVGALGELIAEGARAAGMEASRVSGQATHAGAARYLAGQVVRGDAVLFKASRGEHLELVLNEWTHMSSGNN